MNLEKTERLIKLLKREGVKYFKDGDIEIEMGGAYGVQAIETVREVDEKSTQDPGAIPPTESEIPHHVNEVQSLLKLSDADLVDKLFPDYTKVE